MLMMCARIIRYIGMASPKSGYIVRDGLLLDKLENKTQFTELKIKETC